MSSHAVEPCYVPVDGERFRQTCSRFATGITVVTVLDEEGAPNGMTVNSFTSVSLDPPLILFCIDNNAAVLPLLLAAEHVGVNVLSEGQQSLSHRFARREHNRFSEVEWIPGLLGVPLLPGALATYECSVSQVMDGGDHRIVLAEVRHVHCHEGRPLLYFNRRYDRLA